MKSLVKTAITIIGVVAASVVSYNLGKRKGEMNIDQKVDEEIIAYQNHIFKDVLKAPTVKAFKAQHEIDILETVLDDMQTVSEIKELDARIRQRQVELEDVANISGLEEDNSNDEEPVYFEKESVSGDTHKTRYNKIHEVNDSDKGVTDFIKKYEKEHGITYDNDEEDEDDEDIKAPIKFDKKPYIIDFDEYEDSMYDKEWLCECVYYHVEEDIIYKEDANIFDKEYFGEENIDDLAPGQTIYIRNETLKTDFEVVAV